MSASGKELARAVTVYVAGKKSSNPKEVKVNPGKISLKAGKTGQVAATGNVTDRREIRYESSNPKIAKVDEKTGKIKGIKKGTCCIYAYAQNGVYKKVTVNVR